ncbi:MAG: hypothetical protein IPM83_11620 [Ignavibacteria bacterium]|nr:hypothetical protein [Ignavibacteria bacterium]
MKRHNSHRTVATTFVMSAFRSAAVCDITREEDEGGSFYSEIRSIFAKVYTDDPDLMWEVHLADTVRTFIFDGPDAEGLDAMIATITAAPFTEDQQFSIDRYLGVEPVLRICLTGSTSPYPSSYLRG